MSVAADQHHWIEVTLHPSRRTYVVDPSYHPVDEACADAAATYAAGVWSLYVNGRPLHFCSPASYGR